MNDPRDHPNGSSDIRDHLVETDASEQSRSFARRHGFGLDDEPEGRIESAIQNDGGFDGRSLRRRPPTRQFNMRMDVALFQRLYRFCESRNLTLTEVVEDAIDHAIRDPLETRSHPTTVDRFPPRFEKPRL